MWSITIGGIMKIFPCEWGRGDRVYCMSDGYLVFIIHLTRTITPRDMYRLTELPEIDTLIVSPKVRAEMEKIEL